MCYSALIKRNLDYLGRKYGAVLVRDDFSHFERASAENPGKFPPLEDRIFPGYYAPVIYPAQGVLQIGLMRYGAYPPPHVTNPNQYTTFNARRDNLTSPFWEGAFMRHHGFVVAEAFYEWVKVTDLLRTERVSLAEVKQEFTKIAEERRQRLLQAGKKYKPTPTELKDPRERRIVIEFQATVTQDILMPVIFSMKKLADGHTDKGFAIVTDTPPPEVLAAGHDRCPLALTPDAVKQWINAEGQNPKQLDDILNQRAPLTFQHGLPRPA